MSDMGGAKEDGETFRCDAKFKEELRAAAAERDVTKSEFIRAGVEILMAIPPMDKDSLRERAETIRKIFVILEKL